MDPELPADERGEFDHALREAEALVLPRLGDDGSFSRQAFEQLCHERPDLTPQFTLIYQGHEILRTTIAELRAEQELNAALSRNISSCRTVLDQPTTARAQDAKRRRVRVRSAVAIAGLAVGSVVLAMLLPYRSQESTPPTADLVVLTAVTDVVRGLAGASPQHVGSLQVDGLRGCVQTARDISREIEISAQPSSELASTLERSREILRALDNALANAPDGSVGASLRSSIPTESSIPMMGTPELHLLVLASFPVRPSIDSLSTRRAREFVGVLLATGSLSLRAFDLDAGGEEHVGAQVFARSIDTLTGELGEPIFLGTAPLEVSLPSGEWRVTVVDPPSRRHAELRIIAFPGQPLEPEVAFLRANPRREEAMVWLEPVTFDYGSPPDQHAIMHSPATPCSVDGFWIDSCEVTNADYAEFVRDVRAHPEWLGAEHTVHLPIGLEADGTPISAFTHHPVVDVSWEDACLFANWSGRRLPTDREWERAAKGPMNCSYPWGDSYSSGSVDDSRSILRGGRPPDEFEVAHASPEAIGVGLVDDPRFWKGDVVLSSGARIHRLADNAAEWVEDVLAYPARGGLISFGIQETLQRVVRGGSWQLISAEQCRTDRRRGQVPSRRSVGVGFRCAASPYPEHLIR